MITLTRRQARRLRGVLRRRLLGLPARGPTPHLVLAREPGAGLKVRLHTAEIAVEVPLTGPPGPAETIPLPIEALAEFEGPDGSPVVLERDERGLTVARWEDRGVPQTRGFDVPDPGYIRLGAELPVPAEAVEALSRRQAALLAEATAADPVGREVSRLVAEKERLLDTV